MSNLNKEIYHITTLPKSKDQHVVSAKRRPHRENGHDDFRFPTEERKSSPHLTRRGKLARTAVGLTVVGIGAAVALRGGHDNAPHENVPKQPVISIDISQPHKQVEAQPGDNIYDIAQREEPGKDSTAVTNAIIKAIEQQRGVSDDEAKIIQPNQKIPLPADAQDLPGVTWVPGTGSGK